MTCRVVDVQGPRARNRTWVGTHLDVFLGGGGVIPIERTERLSRPETKKNQRDDTRSADALVAPRCRKAWFGRPVPPKDSSPFSENLRGYTYRPPLAGLHDPLLSVHSVRAGEACRQ